LAHSGPRLPEVLTTIGNSINSRLPRPLIGFIQRGKRAVSVRAAPGWGRGRTACRRPRRSDPDTL